MKEGRRRGRDRKGFEGGENLESGAAGLAGLADSAGFQQEGHGSSYSDY